MSEWKPIDTAPHGELVLLWVPATQRTIAEMEVGAASWGWRSGGISNMSYHGRATHWMPLPAPPSPPPLASAEDAPYA